MGGLEDKNEFEPALNKPRDDDNNSQRVGI